MPNDLFLRRLKLKESETLKQEILKLINLKKEGPYWDFKKEWYDSKTKPKRLLHDIICMANNICNKDAYIIIGIDEENDYLSETVKNKPNRMNTQNLVDFLKDKPFADDNRPSVCVETIYLDENEIDVIVVRNSNLTPYYLNGEFKGLNPGNIYTRVENTNTPINRTADFAAVEFLWKKHFGLNLNPIERFSFILKEKEKWSGIPFAEQNIFYNPSPEYSIHINNTFEHDPVNQEYYMLNQTNRYVSYFDIELKYQQTVLSRIKGVSLDSGRYSTNCPPYNVIAINQLEDIFIRYNYFIKDSLELALNEFFYVNHSGEERCAHDKFIDNVLIFENKEESVEFENYVLENWYSDDRITNYKTHFLAKKCNKQEMSNLTDDYIKFILLKEMFEEFKAIKTNNKTN